MTIACEILFSVWDNDVQIRLTICFVRQKRLQNGELQNSRQGYGKTGEISSLLETEYSWKDLENYSRHSLLLWTPEMSSGMCRWRPCRWRKWAWSTHATVSASLLPVAGSMQTGLAAAYSRRQRDSDLRAHSAI